MFYQCHHDFFYEYVECRSVNYATNDEINHHVIPGFQRPHKLFSFRNRSAHKCLLSKLLAQVLLPENLFFLLSLKLIATSFLCTVFLEFFSSPAYRVTVVTINNYTKAEYLFFPRHFAYFLFSELFGAVSFWNCHLRDSW